MADVMDTPPRICLLCGPPGCGKTTLLHGLAGKLSNFSYAGFLTEEIREQGKRQGFTGRCFDGCSCVLAHRRIHSGRRIGAYGVDLAAFEREIVASLSAASGASLFIIDEIGKMELLSPRFVAFLDRLIAGNRLLLATIPTAPLPIVRRLIDRPDTQVIHLTAAGRSAAARQLAEWCARHQLGGPELSNWAAAQK
jgi:nucleoside-triphosphatase